MTVYTVDYTPGGIPVLSCECGAQWLPYLNKMAIKLGFVKTKIDVLQGGYRNGQTAASSTTHNGGGAFDFAQYSTPFVKLVRMMGGAAWHRTVAQGFDGDHCHCEMDGCTHHAGVLGQYQVDAYHAGYNGLGDGYKAKDDGPRLTTMPTWQQGISWAKLQLGEDLTMTDINNLSSQIESARKQIHYDIGVTQNSIKSLANQMTDIYNRLHHDIGVVQTNQSKDKA